MSKPEIQVKVTPKISTLNANVSFEFIFDKDYNQSLIKQINSKLILDIVYLKQNIELGLKKVEYNKENHIVFTLDNLALDKINENSLFNISTINFDFLDQDNKSLLEKVLILQVIKDKGEVQKHII